MPAQSDVLYPAGQYKILFRPLSSAQFPPPRGAVAWPSPFVLSGADHRIRRIYATVNDDEIESWVKSRGRFYAVPIAPVQIARTGILWGLRVTEPVEPITVWRIGAVPRNQVKGIEVTRWRRNLTRKLVRAWKVGVRP